MNTSYPSLKFRSLAEAPPSGELKLSEVSASTSLESIFDDYAEVDNLKPVSFEESSDFIQVNNELELLDSVSKAASVIASVNAGVKVGVSFTQLTPSQLDLLSQCYRILANHTPKEIKTVPCPEVFTMYLSSNMKSIVWNQDPYLFAHDAINPEISEDALVFRKDNGNTYSYNFLENCPLKIGIKQNGMSVLHPLKMPVEECFNIAAACYAKKATSVVCSFGTVTFNISPTLLQTMSNRTFMSYYNIANSIQNYTGTDPRKAAYNVVVIVALSAGRTFRGSMTYHKFYTEGITSLVNAHKGTFADALALHRWVRESTVLDAGFCKDIFINVANGVIQQSVAVKHAEMFDGLKKFITSGGTKEVAYVGVVIPTKSKKNPPNLGVYQFLKLCESSGIQCKLYDICAEEEPTPVTIQGEKYLVHHIDVTADILEDHDLVVCDCNTIAKVSSKRHNDIFLDLVAKRARRRKATVVKLHRDDNYVSAAGHVKIIASGRLHSGEVFGFTSGKNTASSLTPIEANFAANCKRGVSVELGKLGLATVGRSKSITPQIFDEAQEDQDYDPSL